MKAEIIVKKQKQFFKGNKTKDTEFRKRQLKKLYRTIKKYEKEIYEGLKKDLGKSEYEAYLTEVGLVLSEIRLALKKLDGWTKPKKKRTPLTHFPGKSFTVREPYGVILILSPWNYPFQLILAPLVGAIAAGNCAVLKCSRQSTHTTAVIEKMIREAFPPCYVACAGEEDSYDDILKERYDYIFFTGSERIGKVVMEAAGRHLTPVSLELGGKSPCFVDESANIKKAAKRIIWGKMLNSGQTCVAPDYILVHEKIKAQLILEMKRQTEYMYGNPLLNENYPKIISWKHFERLCKLIDGEKNKIGGEYSEVSLKIAPAILPDCTFDSPVMKEEIFGPIIPVISYTNLEDAIRKVKDHPKPLACYLFSRQKSVVAKILTEVSFGGGCVNDTVLHLANHYLPFGGVGTSGMGNYHGKYSFDTFTHEKGILCTKEVPDLPFRYAPFLPWKLAVIRLLLK